MSTNKKPSAAGGAQAASSRLKARASSSTKTPSTSVKKTIKPLDYDILIDAERTPELAKLMTETEIDTDKIKARPTFKEKKKEAVDQERRLDEIPTCRIKAVTFSLVDPDSPQWRFAPRISIPEEKGQSGDLTDEYMGPSHVKSYCGQCSLMIERCPGHEGIIVLSEPVYHPNDIACRTIAAVLNSVCMNDRYSPDKSKNYKLCPNYGGLILSDIETEQTLYSEHITQLEKIAERSHGVPCPVCDVAKNVVYKRMNETRIIHVGYASSTESKVPLSPSDARVKLEAVTNETIKKLGFNEDVHPKLLILKIIPVMPPAKRWPNMQQGGYRPHQITEMYQDIIKANNILSGVKRGDRLPMSKKRVASKKDDKTVSDYTEDLVHHVQHFIQNSDGSFKPCMAKREPYKGMAEVLTGKRGMIRGTQRKRTDFTGRTVAGPSPFAPFDCVDLPVEARKKQTFPEIATPANIEILRKMHAAGETTRIEHNSGSQQGVIIDITDRNRDSIKINYGDRVHRYQIEGDWVKVNRQPTLHRFSIIGFKVRHPVDEWGVSPSTNRLNTNVTTPFNADFDGDEINVHAPQSYKTRTEIMLLMSAAKYLMNGQTNINTMGVIYDGVVGAYLMTRPGAVVKPRLFYALADWIDGPEKLSLHRRLQKHGVPMYSGRATFSLCLPENFNYTKGDVMIRDGVLVRGQIKKSIIGITEKSIVSMILRQYGEDRAVRFMTECPRLMYIFITEYGYSIDLSDCLPMLLPKETRAKIERLESRLESLKNMSSEDYISETRSKIEEQISVEQKLINQGPPEINPLTYHPGTHQLKVKKYLEAVEDAKSRLKELKEKLSKIKDERDTEIQATLLELESIERDPIKAQTALLEKQSLEAKLKVYALEQSKANAVSQIERDRIEQLIKVALSNQKTVADTIMANTIKDDNRIMIAIRSGGKGSEANLSQIIGNVGQQFYRGERLTPGPYFTRNDPDPEAKGYCSNSWISGLTLAEYYSVHVAGREGLTDTSIKTSETGYMSRRLATVQEDFEYKNDGMVRIPNGRIISYNYGGDGHAGNKRLRCRGEYADGACFTDIGHLVDNLVSQAGY